MSYFLVFYMGQLATGVSYGSAALAVDNNSFLNQKKTVEFIKEFGGFSGCVITNIIRLTKEEYDEWTYDEIDALAEEDI